VHNGPDAIQAAGGRMQPGKMATNSLKYKAHRFSVAPMMDGTQAENFLLKYQ
jgi:hypothetical protein